ncbi:Uncharacterized protein Adt_36352 [Abeliophyllum distichum]|uniref:Uncharacterized protein n=1 Tax=Abeliophyllum distichum TaxID=126358 RepID=A0ABD1QL39_9LAMI
MPFEDIDGILGGRYRSTFHGVLDRPTLKDLQAVTSIHHLATKFPTPCGVAKVRSNQIETRACYMNALQKVAKREDALPTVRTIQADLVDINPEKVKDEMILDKGLDSRIIGSYFLAFPAEELEVFSVHPSDPT